MSRVIEPSPSQFSFQQLSEQQIDAIMAIEVQAYEVPWSKTVMRDCLIKDYSCMGLFDHQQLIGYYIVQAILDEAHILNFCIAPTHQGQGLASIQMQSLIDWAKDTGIERLLLEVRRSQKVAREFYLKSGFEQIGERKGYYPTPKQGIREDALVMVKYLFENE